VIQAAFKDAENGRDPLLLLDWDNSREMTTLIRVFAITSAYPTGPRMLEFVIPDRQPLSQPGTQIISKKPPPQGWHLKRRSTWTHSGAAPRAEGFCTWKSAGYPPGTTKGALITT
jgi:hypothetical protein